MVEPVGVLGEIVARKRVDVAQRLDGVSFDDLMSRAQPTQRSLAAVLAKPGARFIMEVKRNSPSEGVLQASADPATIARAYAGAADAISVLVDTPYFGGSYADLEAVRTVFDGPILAKDFVIDPRQVPEARLAGADAVLVMLSVLDDGAARDVMTAAERLDMDYLVEAHTEEEVRRAVALGAKIIGINNRDLTTLRIDLAVTEALAHLVPNDRILVSESGITNRADVDRIAPIADAFLVGSSLMKASRPAEAARALAYGRVKICGLTDPGDVDTAIVAGAAFTGFIMVPGTPRAVTVAQAALLAETVQGRAATVGVFRNEGVAEVAAVARSLAFDAVQLHGSEDLAFIAELRKILPETTEIWAAGGVDQAERSGADRILYDSVKDGRSGGTGSVFDWSRLAGRDLSRALLAGGIGPANAAAAAKVGAYALDVSSGVEASPGRKDHTKLAALFAALRATDRKAA